MTLMAKQSKAQQGTVSRVMHEFKRGELQSSTGGKIKKPKQAIAIALSEAGASRDAPPAENARNLRRTKAGERRAAGAEPTRDDLYDEARRKGIAGRSSMSKAQLRDAVGR